MSALISGNHYGGNMSKLNVPADVGVETLEFTAVGAKPQGIGSCGGLGA